MSFNNKGLAPHTAKVIEKVSQLECIKPYVLVGGTALSLQLDHRQSEDLDFMSWASKRGEKPEVNWVQIEKELKTIGNIQKLEILGFDHVEFIVEDVKFSFYACDKLSPIKGSIPYLNNIVLADIASIASMKMEVLMRRSNFRDYYDLYCIMDGKAPQEIKKMITDALKYSNHHLSSKNLLSMLTTGSRFINDDAFKKLEPKFDLTQGDIELFMKEKVQKAYLSNEIAI